MKTCLEGSPFLAVQVDWQITDTPVRISRCYWSNWSCSRRSRTRSNPFRPALCAKAAFESPKVAAHGDFASMAAMQLAKPLDRKPRNLAEELSAALLTTPAFGQ